MCQPHFEAMKFVYVVVVLVVMNVLLWNTWKQAKYVKLSGMNFATNAYSYGEVGISRAGGGKMSILVSIRSWIGGAA